MNAIPFGARVRHVNGGPDELLVVDVDPDRAIVAAAWKTGDTVSERWFPNFLLELVKPPESP